MNDRLIIKKAIRTFSRVGDMLLDEVEVGMPTHGNVDLMLVSLLLETPPVCFSTSSSTLFTIVQLLHLKVHQHFQWKAVVSYISGSSYLIIDVCAVQWVALIAADKPKGVDRK